MSSALERIRLVSPRGETVISVGEGALEKCSGDLSDWLEGRSLYVVSCRAVLDLHEASLAPLRRRASRSKMLEIPDGEPSKSLETAGRIWEEMLAGGGRRDSRLVTFGGGTVGDLGGFVAGCFLRGIEYVQVPTTLLAQVDASVGGKTGVNLAGAKNSVGLFHHPVAVIVDTGLLKTLPDGEMRSGLVEAIKMAVLFDVELLDRIERDLEILVQGEPAALTHVVAASIRLKKEVVQRDPAESGERRLLNFGHTLAHALEQVSGYGRLRHGEAVAYGILFALGLSESLGLDSSESDRVRRLLVRLGLAPLPPVDAGNLMEAMRRDKKARESGLAWVVLSRLGRGEVIESLGEAAVQVALDEFLDEIRRGRLKAEI